MCADKLANSMQTTADNSNLLATKAIANRFSVRHHVLHCDQFHPPTANSCHNSLSRQATHKYFNCQSLVTGNLSPKNYSQKIGFPTITLRHSGKGLQVTAIYFINAVNVVTNLNQSVLMSAIHLRCGSF